jgi:hypothetical protein
LSNTANQATIAFHPGELLFGIKAPAVCLCLLGATFGFEETSMMNNHGVALQWDAITMGFFTVRRSRFKGYINQDSPIKQTTTYPPFSTTIYTNFNQFQNKTT